MNKFVELHEKFGNCSEDLDQPEAQAGMTKFKDLWDLRRKLDYIKELAIKA